MKKYQVNTTLSNGETINSGTIIIPDATTIPIANSTTLGGVMPVNKTDGMTQEVGVDSTGKLYTAPGGGSGLQIKQITFTDRPSLIAWHNEQFAKGTQYLSVLAKMAAQNYESQFNSFELNTNLFKINKYLIYNYDTELILQHTIVNIDSMQTSLTLNRTVTFNTSNSVSLGENTTQVLPDNSWTGLGLSVTITYIE